MGVSLSWLPSLLLAIFSLLLLSRGLAVAGVPLGTTLLPNSTAWTSPNSTFSLSFVPDNAHPYLFLAAISYSGGVPVWTAGAAALVDSNASLILDSTGNLRLLSGSGSLVWHSDTANKSVTAAVLDDFGNLRLMNASGGTVWQSFDHPTDTLLPSQVFTLGQSLRSGPYSFSLLRTGNLALTWNDSVLYYNKGPDKRLVSPTLTLQRNGIISLLDASLLAPAVIAYSSNYGESGDMLRFLRLDGDGNLRAYSSARGSGVPVQRWAAVADQCEVFGYCGNLGVCSYNDTAPVCGCPSRDFVPVDPADSRAGCRQRAEIESCAGNTTMVQLDNTQFLTYPPEVSTDAYFVGITGCRMNCFSGRSCVAATSLADGSGLCYLKVSNFLSGYRSPALPSTSFIKVCADS